jgi:hypothetical protein
MPRSPRRTRSPNLYKFGCNGSSKLFWGDGSFRTSVTDIAKPAEATPGLFPCWYRSESSPFLASPASNCKAPYRRHASVHASHRRDNGHPCLALAGSVASHMWPRTAPELLLDLCVSDKSPWVAPCNRIGSRSGVSRHPFKLSSGMALNFPARKSVNTWAFRVWRRPAGDSALIGHGGGIKSSRTSMSRPLARSRS